MSSTPEFLGGEQRQFRLGGVVGLRGRLAPPHLNGRIYRIEDFATPENVEYFLNAPEHSIYRRGLYLSPFTVGRHSLVTRRDLPGDIILAAQDYLDEPEQYFGPGLFTAIRALLLPGGILSHGMILTREMARNWFPEHFIALGGVDVEQLQSGDKVEIDIAEDGKAVLAVTRNSPGNQQANPFRTFRRALSYLVPKRGVEPPRPCGQ